MLTERIDVPQVKHTRAGGILVNSRAANSLPTIASDSVTWVDGKHEEPRSKWWFLKNRMVVPYTELFKSKGQFSHVSATAVGRQFFDANCQDCQCAYNEYPEPVAFGRTCPASWPQASGTDPLDPNGYPALRVQAFAEANEASLQVLVELAEMHKAVDTIVGFGNRLRDRVSYMRNARRTGKSELAAAFDIFGAAWLEGRYGWNQLVYAAQDIKEVMARLDVPVWKVSVANSAQEDLSTSTPGNIIGVSSPWLQTVKHRQLSDFLEERCSVAVSCSAHGRSWDVNPWSAAWELVRYTWILDWFFTIGDNLKANWRIPNAYYTACESAKLTQSDVTRFALLAKPCTLGTGRAGEVRHDVLTYHRKPIHEGLHWDVELKDDPLSWMRVTDAMSLVWDQARGLYNEFKGDVPAGVKSDWRNLGYRYRRASRRWKPLKVSCTRL